jgi:hypothetical protein
VPHPHRAFVFAARVGSLHSKKRTALVVPKIRLSLNCFVTGHDLSRAENPADKSLWALAPAGCFSN